MIAYLLKSLISSGLFLLAYVLFLEKEKMHRFNRFYLLFALLFSIVVPFLSIHSYSSTLAPISNSYQLIEENLSRADVLPQPMKNTSSMTYLLLLFYGGISLFLFLRLLYILYGFYSVVSKNRKVPVTHAKLVLLDNPVSPHTFLHYIFLSKDDYIRQTIEPEIIAHETAHVKQRHSLDILLLELILVFCWFNPLLLLYRKAIQLNHEYLADDAVIKPKDDISSYQYLLINRAVINSTALLPSHFNFLTIKKRLTMMTKTTSRKKALLIQWAIAPAITGLALSFCIDSIAQEKGFKSIPEVQIKEYTVEGVSPELIKEYEDIVNKHKSVNSKGVIVFKIFLKEERDRLETIFKLMSRDQQKNSSMSFVPPPKPLPKIVPTTKQMKDFTDPKNYGVWIDNKKVSNEELKKYKASDFSNVFISRLYGKARSSVTYNFQVNLLTNKAYQEEYQRAINDKRYVMMFKWNNAGAPLPEDVFKE